MNPWAVLEISPTLEVRAIKQAYTRLLRKHPPETDPEGFKCLRTAYEAALTEAESPRARAESFDGATESWEVVIGFNNDGDLVQAEPVRQVQAIIDRLEEDFYDPEKRGSALYWREALAMETIWNLDLESKEYLGRYLFGLLGRISLEKPSSSAHVAVPREAWLLFEETFGWLENEVGLSASFSEDFLNSVLDPVRSARGLKTSADLVGKSASKSTGLLGWVLRLAHSIKPVRGPKLFALPFHIFALAFYILAGFLQLISLPFRFSQWILTLQQRVERHGELLNQRLASGRKVLSLRYLVFLPVIIGVKIMTGITGLVFMFALLIAILKILVYLLSFRVKS